MNAYSIALFLHIVSAVGIFIALGLEWTGLMRIRSAQTPQQVREWMGILGTVRILGFASMLTVIISGFYMTATVVGGPAWVIVTLGALVLVMLLFSVFTVPRMKATGRAVATETAPLSQAFYSSTNHPLLSISIHTRSALALGIVFLKVVKPDWGGSLLTIGVAIVLGLASALSMRRRQRAREGRAD